MRRERSRRFGETGRMGELGFTLTETLIVCVAACIVVVAALPLFDGFIRLSNADAAAQLVAQQLAYARALAVGTRGKVVVQCDPVARTVVVAPRTGSVRGPFALPGRMRFMSSALSPDTPDGLGASVLGGGSIDEITFLDNGAAVSNTEDNTLCSGTFFIEQANGEAASRRAVTLLGGTGRIRIWRYDAKTSGWK